MRRFPLVALGVVLISCAPDVADVTGPPTLGVVSQDSLAPLYEMDNPRRIPDQYLVRFKDDVANPKALADQMVSAFQGSRFRVQSRALWVWSGMKGFWGKLPPEAISALRANRQIRYIEADTRIPLSTTVEPINLPYGNWGLDRIDQRGLPLDHTYSYDYDGTGVRIWIVDTGVDEYNPDLVGRVDHSFYVTYNGTNPWAPCHSHGTNVAILAAGTAHGVAKGATINVARVSDDCVDGDLSTGASSAAFDFIATYSPRPAVANFSAGHECAWWGCGPTVDDAIKHAIQTGVQVMVSAGNDGNDACDYTPAHVAEAITVGASDASDHRVDIPGWWSSNYGSCLDLFAPGVNLYTGDTLFAGTSGATPLVTGTAALFLQVYPTASPLLVTQLVLGSATTGTLQNIGSGSPNKLLYARVTPPPPPLHVSSVTTNPSPARQYQPFTLTVNGSGFNPAIAQIVITGSSMSSCPAQYGGCVITNGNLEVKTETQLVEQTFSLSIAGTYDVAVRNGSGGGLSNSKQITLVPLY